MGGFEHAGEHLQRGVEVVCGAWSAVQAVCDDIKFGLGVDQKICAPQVRPLCLLPPALSKAQTPCPVKRIGTRTLLVLALCGALAARVYSVAT
jgi:hypothetical protein